MKKPETDKKEDSWIRLKGAKTHNLQSVDLEIPTGQMVVFSGVSGSGKSSIAFDTLFAEGQRRYVESLSSHMRRHLDQLRRPEMLSLEGLSPTIAIEQKSAGKNPRSTVATMTEIHDHLRVLWARLATAHCPISGKPLTAMSQETILAKILHTYKGQSVSILAPVVFGKKAEFENERKQWQANGFLRALVDEQLREIDEPWNLDPERSHDISLVIDRLRVEPEEKTRVAEALFKALELTDGLCQILERESESLELYSTQAYSEESGLSYRALEPEDFSFNSEKGMCKTCQGLGQAAQWNLEKAIDPKKSIAEDCCLLATSYQTVRYHNIYNNLARLFDFDVHTPWKKLSPSAKDIFLNGSTKRWLHMEFVHPETGKTWHDRVHWPGVLQEAWQRYSNYKTQKAKEAMRPYLEEGVCRECQGDRLQPYAASAKLGGISLPQFCRLTASEALQALRSLKLDKAQLTIGREMITQVITRLEFLCDVGLDYLCLDRTAPTLSGGEAQRVRLSSQIGSGLVGVTYILDEPSIGLHARDNERLIGTLKKLSERGSNVIVVEHDEETILSADYVVDFGPGAGSKGGKIVYSGPVKGLLKDKESLTGAYLSGKKTLAKRSFRKPTDAKLTLKGVRHHNLQGFDVDIPLGLFVVVSGVSGSGKSSLISETLHPALINHFHLGQLPVGAHQSLQGLEHLDKVIGIDQTPIGRLPRSNPATYIKVFDDIRDLFSQLPESKARGYAPGRFSFNVKEGSCSNCQGMGYIRLEMDFLEDEYILCQRCEGQQFDEATLSILYKGKSIRQVLEMSVDEAMELFQDHPSIARKLQLLQQVGLGYLPLGQPSPQLSGGEAQRIKLAKELVRPASGRTLYILDEPTTGLHLHDISLLMEVLHKLVDRGNSVLMIEHHLEVIKQADWIIEIGPEGGKKGGKLIATGTPHALTKIDCPTGRMLKRGHQIVESAPQTSQPAFSQIEVIGARQHNLKGQDFFFPRSEMTALVGPSGSGKSSLALETLYASGQRKYVECLSPYARQFVKPMPQPRVERIEGLSPSIAVETRESIGNMRSTVGTLTEVYDYLRLLYTRLGVAYCPKSGELIESVDVAWVRQKILKLKKGTKLQILAPYHPPKTETMAQSLEKLARLGYTRIRIEGTLYEMGDELETLLRSKKGQKLSLEVVVDRIKAQETETARLDASIELAKNLGKDILILNILDVEGSRDEWVNMGFCVPSTGASYPPVTPQLFAFNTQQGQCPICTGIGQVQRLDLARLASSTKLKLFDWIEEFLGSKILRLAEGIQKLKTLKAKRLCDLEMDELAFVFDPPSSSHWPGLNALAHEEGVKKKLSSEQTSFLLSTTPCPTCEGSRLNALARHVEVMGVSLTKLVKEPLPDVLTFIEKLKHLHHPRENGSIEGERVLHEILDQLQARMQFLIDVGLSYLDLNRSAPTLSGGEIQRIRLAAQLGAGLSGILYVLDEPCTGLHMRDSLQLLQALDKLKKLRNTLVIVEHQPHLLQACDRVIELGPGAGTDGGWIQHIGSPAEMRQIKNSPTGQFLETPLHFKKAPRKPQKWLQVRQARAHHLQRLDVDLPLGVLGVITGVSGSGKSTLVEKILLDLWKQLPQGQDRIDHPLGSVRGWQQIESLDFIDSEPLGLTSRSDVGSYIELLPKIRELFAMLPEAKTLGLKSGHFSPNTRKGMCKSCHGLGYRIVDLRFMPAIHLPCSVCEAMRLNPVSLTVKYHGLNFGELLRKSASELIELMGAQHAIVRRLQALIDVGLGYLPIGFEAALLSVGEGQRLKLAARLWRLRKNCLYLLDEPCKGLHPSDVLKLHATLDKLVQKGHSVLCIEHQPTFISAADWMIELGPEAGLNGGKLVASAPPLEIAEKAIGQTGQYLRGLFNEAPSVKTKTSSSRSKKNPALKP